MKMMKMRPDVSFVLSNGREDQSFAPHRRDVVRDRQAWQLLPADDRNEDADLLQNAVFVDSKIRGLQVGMKLPSLSVTRSVVLTRSARRPEGRLLVPIVWVWVWL